MKKQVQQEENIGYRIVQIKTHKISITEPDHIEFEDMTVSGKVNFSVKVLNNVVEMLFDIVTEYVDANTKEVLISHMGRTKYEAVNIPISEETKMVNIPDQLVVTLYAMAHSHARALLASDLQNTIYKDKVFTPVIDPKEILNHKEDQ